MTLYDKIAADLGLDREQVKKVAHAMGYSAPLRAPDLFKDVGDFHRKFSLEAHPTDHRPELLPPDVLKFRLEFMQEELDEFRASHDQDDLAGCADALADLVYVALGTAHLMGIPFDDVWAEVQRANMTKVRATGADDPRTKRKHAMDVVKPAGFVPPDHRRALRLLPSDILDDMGKTR